MLLRSLQEKTCRKLATQSIGHYGREPTPENVLVAWTVYVNWDSVGSQQCDNAEMMQRGRFKLVRNLPVKFVLFESDRDENVGVPRGRFY